MKRTLLLRSTENDTLTKNTDQCQTKSYYNIRNNSFFVKLFRKLNLYVFSILIMGNWKNKLNNYDTIIMFDNGFSKMVSKYIKKHNKNIRTVLWFWNPVTATFLNDCNIDEFWSYQKSDCIKYNLKYNTQFYNSENVINNDKIEYDVFFLGSDKNRSKMIFDFKKILKKHDISSNIIVFSSKNDKAVTYNEYLDLLSKTKCILDIVNKDVDGLTLRCLEALFFKKKLITNNQSLMKYDFYNKNNIFILGKDDNNKLKKFINSKYEILNQDIINYYSFDEWLKRFYK